MTMNKVQDFICQLAAEDRSQGTIEKYQRDVRAFVEWLGGLELEEAAGWKDYLLTKGYTPATVNSMLSAVNRFLKSSEEGIARSDFCASSARRSGTKNGN